MERAQTSRARAAIPFVPYIAVSILHVVLNTFELPGGGFATKQLLMPALAIAALWATQGIRPWPRPGMLLVLAALLFSWIGDGAGLFFSGLPTLPMMILCFGVAHLAYIALFWRAPGITDPRRVPWWAAVYAVWWIGAVAVIGPHSGGLLIPLCVYGLVLGGTAALSTRLGPLVAWGGASFLVSDTLIAVREFLEMPDWTGDWIMPTYTLGQGLIVFGVVAALRRGRASRPAPA